MTTPDAELSKALWLDKTAFWHLKKTEQDVDKLRAALPKEVKDSLILWDRAGAVPQYQRVLDFFGQRGAQLIDILFGLLQVPESGLVEPQGLAELGVGSRHRVWACVHMRFVRRRSGRRGVEPCAWLPRGRAGRVFRDALGAARDSGQPARARTRGNRRVFWLFWGRARCVSRRAARPGQPRMRARGWGGGLSRVGVTWLLLCCSRRIVVDRGSQTADCSSSSPSNSSQVCVSRGLGGSVAKIEL